MDPEDSIDDGTVTRCPRLGGDVPFGYCCTCGEERLPCFKIFDCWWERFDVVGYLSSRLSPSDMDRVVQGKPRHKLTSLLDLVEQAKRRAQQ